LGWEGCSTWGESGDLPGTKLLNFRVRGLQAKAFLLSLLRVPHALILFLFIILLFLSVDIGWSTSVNQQKALNLESLLLSTPVQDTVIVSDTLRLDDIVVRSTRIREPLRYQPVDVQLIDSLRLSNYDSTPISDILSRYSSLMIRDNGPGGLATLSQRGLSPGQTSVLWEGFPINSLSLGLADLSAISTGLFQNVEVSPGTPSSTFGGGSLGGTVFLKSSGGERESRIGLSQSAGSFGTWNSRAFATISENRWSGSIRAIYNTADNDFNYYNRATQREETRTHNASQSINLMGNINYELSKGRIYSSLWYFDQQDEVPGNILAGSTQADQSFDGIRWIGGVETNLNGWNIDMRSFLERNSFDYVEPASNIDSKFTLGRALLEVDIRRPSLGRVVWQGGIQSGLEWVSSNNYNDNPQRRQVSFRMNPEVKLAESRLRLTPTLRADLYSDFGSVISPSIGVNWEVVESLFYLRGMVSRDFNPPTFNDLYWVPSGNRDLNPERSFKTEGGVVLKPQIPFLHSISVTGYRIWLDDGIYWFPDNEGRWTPTNVEKVDAYGAETRLNSRWQISDVDFSWNIGLDWRKSEIAAPRFPDDQGVGRQMRYVPEWAMRSDLTIRIEKLMVHANYRWTDHRFITEDHFSVLDSYRVLDVGSSVNRQIFGADWRLQFSVNNLLNEQYEIIQWYPMPGRHFNITLGINLP